MAYFVHKPEQEPQRLFRGPVEDGEDLLPDIPEDDGGPEDAERVNAGYRLFAGVGDFVAVLAGTGVILALMALLISLLHWLQSDIMQTVTLLQSR